MVKSTNPSFTFADLFAGIGGMRMAFERAGGVCVLTSEIDSHARVTYANQRWASEDSRHLYVNDVVDLGKMQKAKTPDFDVMVAGFPCQPYSIAGLRQGLDDEKGRGQVFLSMLDILKKKKPKAFLFENVKGMLSHDGGRTIAYMVERLRGCGYDVLAPTVLNSMVHGGVPQNRERVFIIGFRRDLKVSAALAEIENSPSDAISVGNFNWPKETKPKKELRDLLDVKGVNEKYFYTAEKYDCYAEIAEAMTRDDTAYQWRRVYVRENKSGVCPALTANMGTGGHNVPLVKVKEEIRKLTPRECARLQGFPESFRFPPGMADAHLYHQFGNSVTVPLIEKIAKELVRHL
jgi:DNA (cytosine-5)-methyltransferase 1